MRLYDKEEFDAKGIQSMCDVPTQTIDGFTSRVAETGTHHKGQ